MTGATSGLARTAWLLTGDREQARDLVQTALTRTYAAWGRVRREDAHAYARRVLVNAHTDWRRRRPWREHPTAIDVEPPARPGPGGADLVDERAALVAALRTLARRERAVVVLRYYADLSEAETADALGISRGAVKSLASRALAKLRVCPELTTPAHSPGGITHELA